MILEALQLLRVKVPGGGPAEARRLSFRALDIEQIGHVYEGLLDHTAQRASEVILGLSGSREAEPEIPLFKLEELANRGTARLVEFLKNETGHWPVEFPEVFVRGGFDAFVGNPPFLGGARISGTFGDDYLAYLLKTNQRAIGNADLSSYFLRRIMSLQREHAVAGIITTNSIAKGETRESGLQFLMDAGVTLFNAVKSQPWPGTANVFVSIIHPFNGVWAGDTILVSWLFCF